MGIDDAIARASEAEVQRVTELHDQHAFDAMKKRVVDDLYMDFATRVKRAGVKPLTVTTIRERPTFMKWGKQSVEVSTGQKAWVVHQQTRDDYESYAPCLAVTEDGTWISARIITDKHPVVLRTADSPPQESYGRRRPPWVDAAEFDKDELKKISDETSTMLAEALKRLGAI